MIKFFEWLWLRGIKNWWSKLRWWKASKEPSIEVMKTTDTTLQENCRYMYQGFDWVMDGIDDLFDTYMPAPYAYNRCIEALTVEGASKLRGDCFTGDTKIKSLDGNSYSFKELVEKNIKEIWVYSCLEDGNIVPAKAVNPVKKTTAVPLIKITLDSGEEIKCTEDHRFMMRDGTYKKAKDIIPNEDSLMPGYFKMNEWDYLMMKNNHRRKSGYFFVHQMVNEYCNGDKKAEAEKRVDKHLFEKDMVITHHLDSNKNNNTPENLSWETAREHNNYHMIKYNKSEAHRQKAAEMGPSNGIKRLLEYNSSDKHKETVARMNKDPEQTKLRFRGHILRTIKNVLDRGEEVTPETYKKNKASNVSPAYDKIVNYFNSVEEAIEEAKMYNHKVSKIEYLDTIEDVYDITVPETHNFLLDAGVFVHNCDDYHGAVLNMLDHNGYDAALITLATIPITQSHTMTAYRKVDDNGIVSYYVVNYTVIKGPYKNLSEFVADYGTPVRYWCLQKYNYKKGKYYNIKKGWGNGNKQV